jgi:hypothetical protein
VWIIVRAFIHASFVTHLSIARGAVAQDVDACVALEREQERHRPGSLRELSRPIRPCAASAFLLYFTNHLTREQTSSDQLRVQNAGYQPYLR